MTDEVTLARVAGLDVAKYGEGWRFQVVDGAFETPESPGPGHVFRVTPTEVSPSPRARRSARRASRSASAGPAPWARRPGVRPNGPSVRHNRQR